MSDLFATFPKLEKDKHFRVTSKRDPSYNCIAWSVIKNDIWLWPFEKPLDGTDWPFDLPRVNTLEIFTQLYEKHGYETCESAEYEEGYQKVAIYGDPLTQKCTHASRLKSDGYWTSKLGPDRDIVHGDPYSVEGKDYGSVIRILKRKNPQFKKSQIKTGQHNENGEPSQG